MKKATAALVLILGFAATIGATAGEIYKWTDADGNTQYGDRPTEDAVRMTAIESRSTDNSRVQANTQARLEKQAERAEAAANEAKEPTPEELRAEKKQRADQCQTYRGQLEKLITSRRLYRENKDGEREYLGEDEMRTARAAAQSKVEEYCSS